MNLGSMAIDNDYLFNTLLQIGEDPSLPWKAKFHILKMTQYRSCYRGDKGLSEVPLLISIATQGEADEKTRDFCVRYLFEHLAMSQVSQCYLNIAQCKTNPFELRIHCLRDLNSHPESHSIDRSTLIMIAQDLLNSANPEDLDWKWEREYKPYLLKLLE